MAHLAKIIFTGYYCNACANDDFPRVVNQLAKVMREATLRMAVLAGIPSLSGDLLPENIQKPAPEGRTRDDPV
ncbi:MAG TPA: hypothetical protein VF934_00515 [Burkholderiales bacterium]